MANVSPAGGRPRSCPHRPRAGGGRTSRTASTVSNPASSRRRRHSSADEPVQVHRRRLLAASHRQRQRARGLVPVGPLEDARLPLEPAGRASRRCPARLGANTSNTSLPSGKSRRWAACRARSFSASSGMWSNDRNGTDHERHPFRDGRFAEVADAQVEQRLDMPLLCQLPGDGQHSRSTGRPRSPGSRPRRSARRCGPSRPRAPRRDRRRRAPRPRRSRCLRSPTGSTGRRCRRSRRTAPRRGVYGPSSPPVARAGRWYARSLMDARALENDGLAAAAAAATTAEIEAVRVEYLGRKSAHQAGPARGARPGDRDGAQRGAGAPRAGDRRSRGGARPGGARRAPDRGAGGRDAAPPPATSAGACT